MSVSWQTELPQPIKVSLQSHTKTRSELCRQARILLSDNAKGAKYKTAGLRSVGTDRQKTQVVYRTHEEVESVFILARYGHFKSTPERNAIERFLSETQRKLNFLGLDIETGKYSATVVQVPGTTEEDPPEDIGYEKGNIVEAYWPYRPNDSENNPSLQSVTVERIGSEKTLVRKHPFDTFDWIPHSYIQRKNEKAMKQRQIKNSCRKKRREADMERLLELCKKHAIQEIERVWSLELIPGEDISFEWNARFKNLGGRYTRRANSDGPMIELSPGIYYVHGLKELLSVVRHEIIHAWQDYHPDGHPPNTHNHHGWDFKQWVDELRTECHCKPY